MTLSLSQKILSSALGVGAAVSSSYGIYKISSSSVDIQPENAYPNTVASLSKNNYSEGSFGKKYGSYFHDTSEGSDEVWWTGKLNTLNKDQSKTMGHFKDITSTQDLRKKCHEMYTKMAVDNSKVTENYPNSLRDENDAWTACSYLEAKPSSGLISTTTESKLSHEDKKGLLINAFGDNVFWKIKNKSFKESFGDTTYKWFKEKSLKEPNKTVRELCQEAYDLPIKPTNDTNPRIEEVIAYCSI